MNEDFGKRLLTASDGTWEETEESADAPVTKVQMLPSQYQITLEWRHIFYSIPQKRKSKKVILECVSGCARPGRLVSILGPSGAGKTTLINALAGRIEKQKGCEYTGSIFINGKQLESGFQMSDISAYVTQEDTLFAFSSVRETLTFACKLRNIPVTRVDEVIRELSLIQAASTRIGNTLARGISGGEKKRVNIGLELLRNPGLIFLDEPTTGLDSYQALSVMTTLKQLSSSRRTVICCIHQPRSAIYALIDDICILTTGGRLVYYGEAGNRASDYFAATYPVPNNYNPADHFMDIVSINYRSEQSERRSEDRVNRLVEMFKEKQKKKSNYAKNARTMGRNDPLVNAIKALGNRRGAFKQFFLSFWLVFQRSVWEIYRNWQLLIFQVILTVTLNLIFGLTYQNMAFSQENIMNRTGLFFFIIMNLAFGPAIETAKMIPSQLVVVQKERLANLYSIFPYYISAFVVEFPHIALPTLAANLILYYMANLRHGWDHFLIFFVTIFLMQCLSNMVGMWFSAMMPKSGKAADLVPIWAVLCLIFSGGTFLKESSIPSWLRWMNYISYVRYPYQVLMVNEFRDAHFEPDMPFDGNRWLEEVGFEDVKITTNLIYIALMILVYFFLGVGCLWFNRPRFNKLKQL